MSDTFNLFSVIVPVLSLHTILTVPSDSTELIRLTIAFTLAILKVPRAKTIVTIAGSPSGIAATASEILVNIISITSIF